MRSNPNKEYLYVGTVGNQPYIKKKLPLMSFQNDLIGIIGFSLTMFARRKILDLNLFMKKLVVYVRTYFNLTKYKANWNSATCNTP